MPKIFGDVAHVNQRLVCRKCGYSWVPTSKDKLDLGNNYKITCPVCRLIKDKDINGFVDEAKTALFIPHAIRSIPYEQLISAEYLNIDVPVQCKICNKPYNIKAKDINKEVTCPHCKGIKLVKVDKPANSIKPKPKKVETKEVEISSKPLKTRDKLKQLVLESKGKVIDKKVKIIGLDENNQCTCECIHCGLEIHVPISIMSHKNRRQKALSCPTCLSNFKNDTNYVESLIVKYIGKVYNGMLITSIYCDEDGVTLCDLECIKSIPNNGSRNPGHISQGISFGDVINRRYSCDKCGTSSLSRADELRNLLSNAVSCKDFREGNPYNYIAPGYNKSGEKPKLLTASDIYTKDGCLCDYCIKKDTCRHKNPVTYSFANIRAISDVLDNLKSSSRAVYTRFPNIYSPNDQQASIIENKIDIGLQVFRDAYIGRDLRLYKFCKCAIHMTEMILSEAEIKSFDHSQCTDKCNKNLRFFDIDAKYLLSNPTKK